jgi:hypothetical protein
MRHAACRAPDFQIFLPRVFPCAIRLAASQNSIHFCHVFYAHGLPYFFRVLFFLGDLPVDFCTFIKLI